MKKFIWLIFGLVIVLGLAACMPAGGGGGTIGIGEEIVAGPGVGQQAVAQQPAGDGTAAPAGAPAAEAEQPGGFGAMLVTFFPFILMFAVVYFLIMRPQRRQAKATKEMQSNLRTGDNVITTSGFFGKIVGEGTDCFLVEFGQDRGVKVWVRKSDIAGVRSPVMTPPPKGEVVEDRGKKDK